MKKLLYFLGILSIVFAISAPRVSAVDNDIGQTYQWPAVHAVIAIVPCQADQILQTCVTQVAVRDPGDIFMEFRAESSGLRAESQVFNTAPSNCDLICNRSDFLSRQCTRLYDIYNRYHVNQRVMSNSNGGAGY